VSSQRGSRAPAIRGSGINVIKLTLGGINSDFAHTVAEIAKVQQLSEVHPDYCTQVRVAADMTRAKREGQLGIILSFEPVTQRPGHAAAYTAVPAKASSSTRANCGPLPASSCLKYT
jgi:hypothetical protein